MPSEPRWLTFEDVELIHIDQLARYGGAQGTKDPHMIHSALANPQNKFHYAGVADLTELAASLCFSIAKNHGYVDGNKRVAAASMIAFLELNGFTLNCADEPDIQPLAGYVEDLAASVLSVSDFADKIYPLLIPAS